MALDACRCLPTFPPGSVAFAPNGAVLATIFELQYEYPSNYGLVDCETFDVGRQPFCDSVSIGGAFDPLANPLWCSDMWCYVNASACNVSTYESSYFPGRLRYSYETCGTANEFSTYYALKQPRPPPPQPPPSAAPLQPPPLQPSSPALPSVSLALDACRCLPTFPPGSVAFAPNGAVLATIFELQYEYPSNYGLVDCETFDVGRQPFCDSVSIGGAFDPLANPLWCSDMWCYVNASACNVSTYESSYFPGRLRYSYETCGTANEFSTYYALKQPRPPPPQPPPRPPAPPPLEPPPPSPWQPSPSAAGSRAPHLVPSFGTRTYLLLGGFGLLFLLLLAAIRRKLQASYISLAVLVLSAADVATDVLFVCLIAMDLRFRELGPAQRVVLRNLLTAGTCSLILTAVGGLALTVGALLHAWQQEKIHRLSGKRESLLDFEKLLAFRNLYAAIVLLTFSNPYLMRMLPWKARSYDGLPSMQLLVKVTLVTMLLEDIPQLTIQVLYLYFDTLYDSRQSITIPVASLCLTLTSVLWRLTRRLFASLAANLPVSLTDLAPPSMVLRSARLSRISKGALSYRQSLDASGQESPAAAQRSELQRQGYSSFIMTEKRFGQKRSARAARMINDHTMECVEVPSTVGAHI